MHEDRLRPRSKDRLRRRRAVAVPVIAMVASLLLAAPVPVTVLASTASSALNWASSPNDLIKNGVDGTFTDATSDFAIPPGTTDASTVRVDILDPDNVSWYFLFSTGTESPMTTGTYTAVPDNGPFFWIQGPSGSSCAMVGSFTVVDVGHAAITNEINSIAVRLSGHCQLASGTFSADLRYASTTGFAKPGLVGDGVFDPIPYTTTGSKDVTIQSVGSGPLGISAVTLTGADAASFTITDDGCIGTIAAGDTCVVTLSHTATTWGAAQTTLRLTTNAIRPTLDVAISATVAPSVVASPTDIEVDDAIVGEASTPRTITFTNVGTASATLGAGSVVGADAGSFALSNDTCSGVVLAAAATCTIDASFYPTDGQPRTAQVTLPVTGAPSAVGVQLSGTGTYRTANITLGSLSNVAPSYSFSDGSALARTTSSYYHAVSSATRVGTTTVKDTGPYEPVLYSRSSTGSTWSAAVRLNSTSQHGVWPGVATSAGYVYADWVKVSKVRSWSASAARYIMFRSNSAKGSGSWSATKRLTSLTGRVDFPSIAASGTNIYIAYTDANSGSVKLLISRNRGSTWSAVTLGTTTLQSSAGGRSGLTSVAAVGSSVIVTWLSNSSGAVKARISTTSGSSWGAASTLALGSLSYPSAAAVSGRLGVAWIGAEPTVRIWQGGAWSAAREVTGVDHEWLVDIYGPALVLIGTSGVGLGYSGCIQVCDSYTTSTRIETDYAESPTNGASWYNPTPTAVGRITERRANDGLSIVVSGPTTREVTYTGWSPGTSNSRVLHRRITVTPEVVSTAATFRAVLPAPLPAGEGNGASASSPARSWSSHGR